MHVFDCDEYWARAHVFNFMRAQICCCSVDVLLMCWQISSKPKKHMVMKIKNFSDELQSYFYSQETSCCTFGEGSYLTLSVQHLESSTMKSVV